MNDQGLNNSFPIIDLNQDDATLLETIYQAFLLTGENDVVLSRRLGISRNTLRSIKNGNHGILSKSLSILRSLGYCLILPITDSAFEFRQLPIVVTSAIENPDPDCFEEVTRCKQYLVDDGWEIVLINRRPIDDDRYQFTLHARRLVPEDFKEKSSNTQSVAAV